MSGVSDSPQGRDELRPLTERERQILALVYRHFTSKQIARELEIGVRTVDTYCDRARRKLGASDRYEASRRIFELEPELEHQGVRNLYGQAAEPMRTDDGPSDRQTVRPSDWRL